VSANTCPVYAWCEEDHESPHTPADEHSKFIEIVHGSVVEVVSLELNDGIPRMYWCTTGCEVWTDQDVGVGSFEEMRDAIALMIAAYDAFKLEVAS
jgi:hypothetical protein